MRPQSVFFSLVTVVVLGAGGATPALAQVFYGTVRCQQDGRPQNRGGILVVPQRDSTTRSLTGGNGSFRVPVRSRFLAVASTADIYMFVGLADEARPDTVVQRTLTRRARAGGLGDQSYQTHPVELDLPCARLSAIPDDREFQSKLVQQADSTGQADFGPTGLFASVLDDVTGGAAGWAIDLINVVGNLAGYAPCDLVCLGGEITGRMVDTLSIQLDRGPGPLTIPFTALSENLGFAFAPLEAYGDAAIWNPAALMLSKGPAVGFQHDFDGYYRGNALWPIKPTLAIGGFYYQYGTLSTFESCILSGVDGTCRELGSGEPLGRQGDRTATFENVFEFEERLGGVSLAMAVNSHLALGVSAKVTDRSAGFPIGVERTHLNYRFPDDPDTERSSTEYWLLTDSRKTTQVDADVGALMLFDRFSVGASAMNLGNSRLVGRDGSEVGTRAFGVGFGTEIRRLNLGADARFHAAGGPEVNFGARQPLIDSLLGKDLHLRVGFSTSEREIWSLGAGWGTATYTFVRGGPGGDRHLTGFRLGF